MSLLAFSVFASGCGGDSSGETAGATGPENSTAETPTGSTGTPGTTGNTAPGENGSSPSDKNGSGESGGTVARDGKWQVGDAGQVDFRVADGRLRLVSVKARSGWSKRIADERPDEIEVHFTRGSVDWTFEAELEHGRLEVSREMDDSSARPGSYDVGDAARVEFGRGNSGLKLNDVTLRKGWKVTRRDVEADEIEIEFSRHTASVEFEAELRDGDIHLEIDLETEGPAPG